MKTLRQLREEYQARQIPEELVMEGFEGKSKSGNAIIPSSKEMPIMLIFRRIQYRVFPNKQVVALYYSTMVDKYLSIPFGPGGNLNLSESTFIDGDKLDEVWPALAAAGAGISALGKLAAGAANVADKVAGVVRKRSGLEGPSLGNKPSTSNKLRTKSGWDRQRVSTPTDKVAASRLKKADLAQATKVAENKISDIRKMIKEGVETKDLTINGRTITINTTMAKRILSIYESVNPKNKKIVEGMMNSDLDSFKKLLNFSVKAN